MFSWTVISLNRLWFCGTWTTPRSRICRGDLPMSFSPRSVIVPSRGLSRPVIAFLTVDHAGNLALCHVEGNAAQHVAAAVARDDPLHGEQRLTHRPASLSSMGSAA